MFMVFGTMSVVLILASPGRGSLAFRCMTIMSDRRPQKYFPSSSSLRFSSISSIPTSTFPQLNMATDSRALQRQNSFFQNRDINSSSIDGGASIGQLKFNSDNILTPMIGYSAAAAAASMTVNNGIFAHSSKQQQQSKSNRSGRGCSPNDSDNSNANKGSNNDVIQLSKEEEDLFELLTKVCESSSSDGNKTILRVAGGWVRDKLLATDTFQRNTNVCSKSNNFYSKPGTRLTSKRAAPSKGRQGTSIISNTASSFNGASNDITNNNNRLTRAMDDEDAFQPLDIDIALDDMLGREFADRLNEWLSEHGRERVSVGVVLKNPEKSKHLETATMKVGKFWIDFVNLRAEEYAGDSRIPDLMRIGTAQEDAFRRDLTINALFYNINGRNVEDLTGRGIQDLRRGIVATPLHPLTTLLDDPLRVLRSIRFAARLRFSMDEGLREAARDSRVREALAMKVSRERIGGEVDLMLRSPDPVGAMRLLINLQLAGTVFPVEQIGNEHGGDNADVLLHSTQHQIFNPGLTLLSTAHDYLCDCKHSPPVWCQTKRTMNAMVFEDISAKVMLIDDEEARRILWYSAFLKPHRDNTLLTSPAGNSDPQSGKRGKKAHRSIIMKLMVDELKRPARDAEGVERIIKAADEFTKLINDSASYRGSSSTMVTDPKTVLMHGIFVRPNRQNSDSTYTADIDISEEIECTMLRLNGELMEEVKVNPETTDNKIWKDAMEYRLQCAEVLQHVKSLWRAALILSLSEQLAQLDFDIVIEEDVIDQSQEEVRMGILAQYDAFAASLLQLGLIGIWSQKPVIDGNEMTKDHILPGIPRGPLFRDIMNEQTRWMTIYPGVGKESLIRHMRETYPYFT